MQFHKMIKEIRLDREMTQSQLASKLGVADATIRGWEKSSEPSYETLCKIAKIFNVTVGQLLGVEEY